MNKARDRRLKATGKWFAKQQQKSPWVNHIFPVLLVISLILLLVNI
tara:strand:+ start:196 stop:333 length:138 start_codon:yes stop_codon:yes gene_type:complete